METLSENLDMSAQNGRGHPPEKYEGGFRLERGISLGGIISTIMLCVAIVSGWNSLSERLAVLESQRDLENGELVRFRTNVREDMREMMRKIDQLALRP
jgi:hypothetical protein